MNILLLGKNGQLGWELQRSLAPLGRLTALDRHGDDGLCGDLSNLESLAATVRTLRPDVIVNAAAYTAVDQAETETDLAWRINAAAPAVLAHEAAACGALLVHYSTDYVFDGSGERPWREDDAPAPLNHYGRTKLAGEQVIQASSCRHLIFRISWLHAPRGANFARKILDAARVRQQIFVVSDQLGSPTGAELVADVSALAIRAARVGKSLSGIYHLSAAGFTSRIEYARYVLADFGVVQNNRKFGNIELIPVLSEHFPDLARRPKNSRLDTSRLEAALDVRLPVWQEGLLRTLVELRNCESTV